MKTQPTQCLTLFAPVIALILLCPQNSRAADAYATAVQADGPIAYYRFGDAAPPTAVNNGSLGAAANGTYFNGAAPGAQAPRSPAFLGFETNNTALQCDGVNDYVSTISGLLNSRPVFTISGWMRRNANQNDRTGLWGQNDLVEFGYINNNTLEVWTDNGLDITPNSIPNGEWAHLAIVSDGSPGTMSMYTNGVLAGSRAHSLPVDNTFPFNIGGGGVFDAIAANGNYFNGQIDEVAIFTKAFTAAQIAAQYQAAFSLSAKTNVFAPGDPIVLVNGVNDGDADAGPPPGGETVDHAIDRFGQKYLNFLDLGSGFATTPSLGPTIVQCLRFYTANDAEERDPASYLLEGSVNGLGGPWTTIASGALSLPSGRNAGGATPIDPATQVNQLVAFPNTTPYTSYRVTFPTLKNAAAANSMQIGEVELLGASFPAAPTIVSQPTNTTVRQALSATFRVSANGSAPLAYQWFCKRTTDAAFAPIPGATADTYTTPPTVFPDDDNKQFKVRVSNAFGTVESQVATLRVNADNVPPSIVSTSGSADFLHVALLFSEELDGAVAVDTFNYSIDGGLTFVTAELSPDLKSVLLTVSASMTPNSVYNVTAHAKDLAGNEADLTASVRTWAADKCGGLVFEAYFGIGGTAISDMTSNPNFPNNPSERGVLKVFDTRDIYPNDSHENYGGSARGLFIPSVSGPWIFYLASDDASQLFLNPNGPDAAGKVLIAEETGCCGQWAGHASAPQNLIAGRGYYIQGLYKEAGGGDYLKVAARLQGQPVPEDDPNQQQPISVNAIPGSMLGYPAAPVGVGGEVTINQQPQGATVEANHSVTFTVAATNPNGLPQCYQWMRNGQPITGATGPTYSTTVTTADDNTCFNVMVAIIGDSKTSADACVRVIPDTTAPRCIGAAGTANLRVVVLTFNERIARSTAEDPFNYSIPGFNLMGNPSLDASETVVTLTLDPPLTPDTAYCVDIRGVTDITGNPIVVPNDPRCCFRTWQLCRGVARREIYMNIGAGVAITDLTGNPKYPNSPDVVNNAELLEGPIDNQMQDGTDLLNNYGERISGFLIPPVSGNYNFWISSDDLSEFWLSTDADPAHKVLLAREPEWNGIRNWTGAARRPAPAANASTTLFPVGISLTAGQMYYFETLHKEGGGGDGCEVTWQTPAGGPSPGIPVNSDGVDGTGSGGNGNGGTKAILGRYMATLIPPGSDTIPPTVVSCKALAPRSRIVVSFSEIVRAAAAENIANYTISGGIGVISATLRPDQRSVELITAQNVPVCSSLTLKNIGDCVNNLIAANTIVPIDVVGGYLASGPQNLIVIEAEHLHDVVRQAGLQPWSLQNSLPGYSGDGWAEIVVDGFRRFHGNTQNLYGDFGARGDYVVSFPVAGTYYLWARGSTPGGNNNSFHMGVDGVNPGDTANRIGNRINNWGGTATGFGWHNDAQIAPASIVVATPGLHMVNIWPREDGTRIDKLVLTTDAAFTLAGDTTTGPPESTREDTVAPVLTCPNGVQAECSSANPVTWTATAVDDHDGPVPVTCTPASGSPFPLGCTTVTCRATDAAGNTCTCSFQVCVVDESAPVVTCPADIVVPPTSPNGASVTYAVGCQDTCGIRSLTCTPPGSQFPCGTTVVTCVCTDNAGNEGRCSFRVTVECNRCPVPVISASALCNGPQTNTFISPNGSNVCFVLDGSHSFDPDGDTLTYHWLMGAMPFASGPKTTNCFPTGEKTITLLVDDGKCIATTNITITVLTACEAVEDLIEKVNDSNLARKNKRPFLASLKAACASFERGNFNSGSNQLGAFINKVRAQLSRNNPEEAALFIRCAQNIIDSMDCAAAGGH